jgi:hypothetical protein
MWHLGIKVLPTVKWGLPREEPQLELPVRSLGHTLCGVRAVDALLPMESAEDVAEHCTMWPRAALPRVPEKKWKLYQM